jgi:hypothetical protein
MKQVTTYVGIDAHKKDLFIAMLMGTDKTPVTWTVPNEPNAVRRLVRKLERDAAGPVQVCYEAGPPRSSTGNTPADHSARRGAGHSPDHPRGGRAYQTEPLNPLLSAACRIASARSGTARRNDSPMPSA